MNVSITNLNRGLLISKQSELVHSLQSRLLTGDVLLDDQKILMETLFTAIQGLNALVEI